ncbi:MAG: FtsB family cell division protein [Rhodothermales bacterium]
MAFLQNVSAFLEPLRTLLLGLAVVFVAIWVLLFDSHSIVTRVQLMAERSELSADNEALQARIDALEVKLSQPISDAEIERIAREDYHMSRPEETVYRVITEK